MVELLKFILSDFWQYLGFLVLLLLVWVLPICQLIGSLEKKWTSRK